MNGYPVCDWLKICKLYKKDNAEGVNIYRRLKKSYYCHSYLCKFVQYQSQEVEQWKNGHNLNNPHKIFAEKWQTFILLRLGKC